MKKTGLNWWCDRAWIKFLCVIAALMTGLILLNWNTWSTELKLIAAISVLIPLHVLEEWVFPGGFHYQYNSFFGSALPDRYPMCRLSDMITNLAGTILYIILTALCIIRGEVSSGMLLSTIVFCFLELIVHTVFGIFMYVKLKAKGKTTIYAGLVLPDQHRSGKGLPDPSLQGKVQRNVTRLLILLPKDGSSGSDPEGPAG